MSDKIIGEDYFFFRGKRLWFTLHHERLVYRDTESSSDFTNIFLDELESVEHDSMSMTLVKKKNKKKYELLSTNKACLKVFVKYIRKYIDNERDREEENKRLIARMKSKMKNKASKVISDVKKEKPPIVVEDKSKDVVRLEKELKKRDDEIVRLKTIVDTQKNILIQLKNIVLDKLGKDSLNQIAQQDFKILDDLKSDDDGNKKLNSDQIRILVDNEFSKSGFLGMLTRDCIVWKATFESINKQVKGVLKRILVVLRYGGLLKRKRNSMDWKFWNEENWPIVSALSHGGRVLIQLPKKKYDNNYDDGFWKWLMSGNPDCIFNEYLSTRTSGDEAQKEKRYIWKRLGSTHSIVYYKENDAEVGLKIGELRKNGEYFDFLLPKGRQKIIYEKKTMGINFRDTKVFLGAGERIYIDHRHWGMNIPLGGENKRSLDGRLIKSDGTNGHLYIYYQSPKDERYGALMIGIEGSEYGKTDSTGGKHGLAAKSNPYSPTYGYKWFSKTNKDLQKFGAPDKYNGMLVDLTLTGWEYLMEKENEWTDDMIFSTSEPAIDIKRDRKKILEYVSFIKAKTNSNMKRKTKKVFMGRYSH